MMQNEEGAVLRTSLHEAGKTRHIVQSCWAITSEALIYFRSEASVSQSVNE